MAESIGARLALIRDLTNVSLDRMSLHARAHEQFHPWGTELRGNGPDVDVHWHYAYLSTIERHTDPSLQQIAWHGALRLCCSTYKDARHLFNPEQWMQPYNDQQDRRLLEVVRTRKIGARWWWRLNRPPRRPGSRCLVCDTPISGPGRLAEGDPIRIIETLVHRREHLVQLALDPPVWLWSKPETWQTPASTGRRSA